MESFDAIKQLEEHLKAQVAIESRNGDFDMNDEPEKDVLAPFPAIQDLLIWLNERVTERWRRADREAMQSQSVHRLLARIAITAGMSAIILAVIQLSLKLTLSRYTLVAGYLEAFSVIAASLAVVVGLYVKSDRRWLTQRYLAERLRMLKFQALQQFVCEDHSTWRGWLESELVSLEGNLTFSSVVDWSQSEDAEAPLSKSPRVGSETARVLAVYYRYKRIIYQADYFKSRKKRFERKTGIRRHLNLLSFLLSVFFVLTHFLAESLAVSHLTQGHETMRGRLETTAIWSAALAVIIPISGLGLRAWSAAFQLPLSASVYGAKYHALQHALEHLDNDWGDPEALLYYLARIEHLLEGEHREWLRLLLETEWFV